MSITFFNNKSKNTIFLKQYHAISNCPLEAIVHIKLVITF